MSSAEDIRDELQRVAREYGKLGLLIDDAPESATRLARALYGSEALPRWWRQLRSLECASWGLDAFIEIFESQPLGRLRGLLIIDRYLPPSCRKHRSIPWDRPDSKLDIDEEYAAHEFRKRNERLEQIEPRKLQRNPGASPAYYVLYVTSFQSLSVGSDDRWQRRSVEIFQEERRAFHAYDHWRGLLRFGPEKDAPVSREKDLTEGRWHAVTWQKNLDNIAELLIERRPVILLTGAGASLAPAPTAPGMPFTDILLEEACARFWKERERRDRSGLTVEPAGCLCEPQSSSPTEPRFWDENNSQAPIDWLIEQSEQQGVAGLRCTLEELFSRDLHIRKEGKESFDDFHSAFRDALYRWDYGYAYHHWLLARMPWTAIITTNFDGFHERAATAAATLPWLATSKRLGPLRYVNPVTWDENVDAIFGSKEPNSRPALFKPYGSLYAPDGSIALGEKEIKNYRNRFKVALDETVIKIKQPGAFIVIGHSMRDPSMGILLDTIRPVLERCDLFWVDPGSFKRAWHKEQEETPCWECWMWTRVKNNGKGGGPIPALAYEFAWDLWATFLKKGG